MGRAHYRYWHNTGTIGCFGAAAAAAPIAGTGRAALRACAGHRRDVRGRPAAGLPHGLDVQAPACRPRCRSRRAAALAAAAGVTGSLDVHGGRGRLRPRDGRRPRLDRAHGHARAGLPHRGHDLQEPRLLRPHLRRDRRRAGAAPQHGHRRRRTSRRRSRHLSARRSTSPATRSRRPPPRPASRCPTSWPPRSCTAACAWRRSRPSGWPTRRHAS